MSNDLVKRLRDLTSLVARTMPPAWREQCELCSGSTNRIEELEAKLATAVQALHQIAGHKDFADDPWDIARTTLAELTGETK